MTRRTNVPHRYAIACGALGCVALLLTGLVVGCQATTGLGGKRAEPSTCQTDTDCSSNQSCVDGRCITGD